MPPQKLPPDLRRSTPKPSQTSRLATSNLKPMKMLKYLLKNYQNLLKSIKLILKKSRKSWKKRPRSNTRRQCRL
jgi:hypothetical protein